jgi:hypothetical protein
VSDDVRVPYAVFGERFFAVAVTEERIARGVRGIAGEPIAFGPIGAGPGKIAQVSATGVVGEASVERLPGDEVCFRLSIPVKLDLKIDLNVDSHTFHALVTVALTLTARAAEPLRVVIDIDDPTAGDIAVELEAETMRGGLLKRVAGIDREIGRFVARYVRKELDKPHIRAARDIDVAARIDGAWKGDTKT